MKKFLLLFLFSVFLASFVSAQCSFFLLNVKSDYTSLPSNIFPGDNVNLNVGLENASETCSAQEINARIALNEKYFDFAPEGIVDAVSVINSSESKPVIFSFTVKESAPAGTYKIPITLEYKNSGAQVAKTSFLYLDVKECFSLDVQNISYSVDPVYAGEEMKIFADIKNSCSGSARDVVAELKPVTNSTFDPFILLSSNVLQVGNISFGESIPVSFSLRPIKGAEPGIYVFELDANCFDCKKIFGDTFSFEVLAKPDLIFSGIDFSNETRSDAKNIFAGESFSFSVQLDNIGKETAKAVKVNVVIDDEVVGSKENFVGNIDPDDSGAAVFDLTVLPIAREGEHTATINVEYLDETGQLQSVSDSYPFFVTSPPSNIFGLIFLLILVIIVLVILYFLVKMVFRQLALRKSKFR